MDKIKVVWLCHLTNDEIQSIIKPRKKIGTYAPWMFISLKIAEYDSSIDLHVVAPHEYISGIKEFELRGIHYHFFNPYIPFYGRHWPGFFRWDYISNFSKTKRIVSKIVDTIKPKVVHLFGAENPQYSAGILPLIKRYPTILTVQGFISHSSLKPTRLLKKRMLLEQQIIKKIPISFYETKKSREDTLSYNPDIELYYNFWGSYKVTASKSQVGKKYDMVFFARICKDKGIVDLLKATAIIKRKKPDVSLCVIGGGNIEQFKTIAENLNISENVIWLGFLPTRQDVFDKAIECKVSVLPTYHDIMPGTIIESMFLGIPMISYATDSNPEINENGEAIKLVEKGDVNKLSKTIYEIITNEELQYELSIKGKKRAEEMFDPSPDKISNNWHIGYKRAIEIFNLKHNARP